MKRGEEINVHFWNLNINGNGHNINNLQYGGYRTLEKVKLISLENELNLSNNDCRVELKCFFK